jgi:hypothetical protein
MVPTVQCARRASVWHGCVLGLGFWALLFALLIGSASVHAQDAPPTTVGRVEGLDVTVDGGAPTGSGSLSGAPSIYVTNGGVVTVHSGQAQMTLAAGGKLDICGPAKFTVLQSGDAITLALNFGRMRIQLPASTQLRIYTPTIIATPLDISGGPRDITVGLDLNDSLCVRAASGALQLEHQFTGERLVVPQAGEFFLEAGKLLPVAGSPGSCQCAAMQARVSQPPQQAPEMGLTAPPLTAEAPPSAVSKMPASEPPVELSIPANNSDSRPKPSEAKNAPPPTPAVSMPEYKVVMPPLVFSADAPAPPPDANPDTILLVRVAHLVPDWEFGGRVDAPPLETATPSMIAGQPPVHGAPASGKRKGGFWAALKRIFVGSKSQS